MDLNAVKLSVLVVYSSKIIQISKGHERGTSPQDKTDKIILISSGFQTLTLSNIIVLLY